MSAPEVSELSKLSNRIKYDGGRNVSYDLTGTDPRMARSEEFVMVFKPNQVHQFPIPVYRDSIKVFTVSNGITQEDPDVSYDPDGAEGWREVDLDTAAMSKAYCLDENFSGNLVSEIEFHILDNLPPNSEHVQVMIKSQRFFNDLYDMHNFDGVGPSYTPGLGNYLLNKIQDLEAVVATNLQNAFASTDTSNDMLEEDLTGTLPANYVNDERHVVATSTGVVTLMPARGSFYAHDFLMWKYTVRTGTVQMANKKYNLDNQAIFIYLMTSTVGGSTTKIVTEKRVYLNEENYDKYVGMAGSFIDRAKLQMLVPDVDYRLTNLNVAKTEKSESEYGVYDTVEFLRPMNGDVLITYHAFGGEVVFEDVQDMKKDIINTMKILSSKNLLTSDILAKQPVIRDILNRLQVIEEYHNHFNRVEHAVYMYQKGFHWIDIAVLYDVAWEEAFSATEEIGTFKVTSKELGWSYEFILSLDLRKKLVDALRVKTLATNTVNPASLVDYIAYDKQRDDVAVRVCWTGTGKESGVVLQLGWDYKNYPNSPINGVDNDTIVVTNKSGIASKWKLVYNPLDNTYDAATSRRVINHTRYVNTSDTVYLDGKDYFKYEEQYVFYKSHVTAVDTSVNDGSGYYTPITTNRVTNYMRVDLTTVAVTDVKTFTGSVNIYGSTDRVTCTRGIYERAMYTKVPKKIENTIAGSDIPDRDKVFEVLQFSEDKIVDMPGVDVHWQQDATGSYWLSQILEPSDGLMVWAGNINLASMNAIPVNLTSFLPKNIVEVLDIMTIRGATFKLYDRRRHSIISRHADVGMYEGVFSAVDKSTEPRAIAGKPYFTRFGDGSIESQYKYVRVDLAAGYDFTSDTKVYYELLDDPKIIGQVIMDLMDLCGAEFIITKDLISNKLGFRLNTYVGTDSVINERFDLRQIDLHF